MKLYYFDTLNPQKACAVARYLNSPVEFIHVDMRKGEHKTPEFLAINPNGKVPAFSDGDLKLWESNAIMCYLAQKAGSDLWPRDERGQIELTRWLTWNSEHFTRHAGELYFQYIIKPKFGLRPAGPGGDRGSDRFLQAICRRAERSSARPQIYPRRYADCRRFRGRDHAALRRRRRISRSPNFRKFRAGTPS